MNYIACYTDDATIYSVVPRPLSCPQEMESLNQDLAAPNPWCLKRHIRLYPKKMKSMLACRSRNRAPGCGDLTLGRAEFEELKNLRILGVTLDLS